MSAPVLPDELTEALVPDRAAGAVFETLSAGEQAHHAQWVASCQSADTRAARVRDVARIVKAQAERTRRDRKRLGATPFSRS